MPDCGPGANHSPANREGRAMGQLTKLLFWLAMFVITLALFVRIPGN